VEITPKVTSHKKLLGEIHIRQLTRISECLFFHHPGTSHWRPKRWWNPHCMFHADGWSDFD